MISSEDMKAKISEYEIEIESIFRRELKKGYGFLETILPQYINVYARAKALMLFGTDHQKILGKEITDNCEASFTKLKNSLKPYLQNQVIELLGKALGEVAKILVKASK